MAECLCKIKSNAIDVLAWFIHMGIQANPHARGGHNEG
jgi:hypothetical protein